jgi:hypothetical protein
LEGPRNMIVFLSQNVLKVCDVKHIFELVMNFLNTLK